MKMKKFNELLHQQAFNHPVEFPSASLTFENHTLSLRFDSKDILIEAGYTGLTNPWLSALCFLIQGKPLNELLYFSWKELEEAFKDDQSFWDFRQEEQDKFIHKPFELLKAALDLYRGRDYLYHETSPLVCRCFGVRESDILEHLQKEAVPTLDTLAGVSKAGMGCRSCVSQLKRWLVLNESKKHHRYYKDRPVADWVLEIDYMLSCYPKAFDWKMELEAFKGKQVVISFDKDISQREEEATTKELQDFLGRALDPDLAFFLRRARHFSNAKE
jgi:bacterioferritin-associated ferredoxin